MADQKNKPIVFNPNEPKQATRPTVKVQVNEPKAQSTEPRPSKFAGCESHKVQQREKLVDIANNWHIALQQLRYFNGLNKNTFALYVGQVIYKPKQDVKVPKGK